MEAQRLAAARACGDNDVFTREHEAQRIRLVLVKSASLEFRFDRAHRIGMQTERAGIVAGRVKLCSFEKRTVAFDKAAHL